MTTWEEILAAVGVGNADLTLLLASGVWPRGATVMGKLALHGGSVPQQIESLTVRLDESISQGKSSEWKTRDEKTVAVQILTVPGTTMEWAVRLRVPDDARLSQHNGMDIWRVSVEADILWAVNPRAFAKIEIVPHHEITAIQRAMEQAGFTRTTMYIDFALRESPDTVVTYFRAPMALREQIDGAALHLRVFGAFVHGRLILNRRQHGVGESLRALVGADREEHPIQIPREALLNDKGGPNAASAAPLIRSILSGALILPENADAKTLLRSADGAPAGAGTLLHPASGNRTEDSNLLRPAEDGPAAQPPESSD